MTKRFPLTATEELDHAALAELGAQGHGDALGEPQHAPVGIASELVAIWKEVLDTSDIQPSASFFDLGGESMSAVRMIALVNLAFNLSLPIVTVFTAPTIADFDRVLREALREQTTSRR